MSGLTGFMLRTVLFAVLILVLHGCSPSVWKPGRDAGSRDSGGLGGSDGGAADTAFESGGADTGGTVGTDDAGSEVPGADGGAEVPGEGGDGLVAGGDLAGTDGGAGAAGGPDGSAGAGGTGGPDAWAAGLDVAPDESDSEGGLLGMDAGPDGADAGVSGNDGAIDAADGGGPAGKDSGADAAGGGSDGKDAAGDGTDGSAGKDGGGDSAGKDGIAGEVNRSDGSSEAGGTCCGCLCRDPTWSCSGDTCVDPTGHALATAAEAGFFEIAGGNYVSESQARVSPGQRIWYSFHPATTTPESKPLAVFFNGGPGSATSAYLFSFNTGPWTLDPAATGSAQIVANPNNWAQFANLLYIDAPGAGFSYPIALDGGTQPSVGIDLDREAAAVLRVVIRFLDRHIPLRSNPVILVGESYGGTRAALMLDHIFNYQLLTTTSAAYQDPKRSTTICCSTSPAVFPQQDSRKLTPQQIAVHNLAAKC
jgi:hypothetical protein